jgi:N-acetylglucosamine-6-phosphate deacetylase
MRIRGRLHATGEVRDVTTGDGLIKSVEPPAGAADLEGGWVAPGLFDLQVNGALGRSFASPDLTTEDVALVTSVLRRHGMTAYFPTLITSSQEDLASGLASIRRARDGSDELRQALLGIHLEGPYISPEDGPRGAHPRAQVRNPDLEELARLQDASGGLIRLVTLAPERPGALAVIEALTRQGVTVALGHTAASPACIRDAVSAGARLSTHLGNGSHPFLPRHENYLWEQLAHDGLHASVIADGQHLPDSVLKAIVRVKRPGKLLLTCDASSLAGLPPGRYEQWGTTLEVQPGGRVAVPGTPFLAGSGVFLDACVAHMMKLGEGTPSEVLDMATSLPRRLLGLDVPTLEVGQPADLTLFDASLRLLATVWHGEVLYPS